MPDLAVVVCIAFDHRAPTEGLRKFKACLFKSAFVETAMEVSGSFDLIVHARLASLTAYTEQIDRIAGAIRRYVRRYESNFVSREIACKTRDERRIWVPCRDGRKSIDVCMIDKVAAEGDYMRLYVGDWHCLLHETIGKLHRRLGDQFIRLHRSALVRTDFIERLIHEDRRWIARLRDGSQQIVAKSHVPDVISLISFNSATHRSHSLKLVPSGENSTEGLEIRVAVDA
ncbi:MAG: LytTR family transcriptional regulator DNA-binding domain-containing protein [Sphingomicrobium sp.]